ncbi:hypothetical protein LUTEI9C_70323 [Luteimonas sp. 9C]|nr:hypothetical protein LUTEI9C_70323 [Luteimonas sp. 9C]
MAAGIDPPAFPAAGSTGMGAVALDGVDCASAAPPIQSSVSEAATSLWRSGLSMAMDT